MSMKKILSLAMILLMVFSSAITSCAWADTIAWEGATDGDWATGANWTLGAAPADNLLTDIASFNLATAYDDAAQFNPVITGSRSVNGLSIGALNNVMTLSGGTLTVGDGDMIVDTSGGSQTISLSLAGAANLTKSGLGYLVLSNANTYTGATTVSAGTLQIGDGGTTGSLGSGGAVTNDSALVFNRSDAMTVANDISGSGTVTQSWHGTTTLSGTNTYIGTTTITKGTLSAGLTGNLGGAASNLVFGGGTLQITGTTLTSVSGIGHTVVLTAGKTVGLDINNAGNTFTFDQVLNQTTGGLTKSGAGTLVLSLANSYTGATTVNGGTLEVSGSGQINSTKDTNVGYAGSGTLNISNGGDVSGKYGYIGLSGGLTGIINVVDAGSTFTLTEDLNLGKSGAGTTGSVNISSGGDVINGNAYLGKGAGTTGTITVDGSGSTWTSNRRISVGYDGSGTLTVTNGGDVDSGIGYIGENVGSIGEVTIDGSGSTWTTGSIRVAQSGTGTLNVTNGATVTSGSSGGAFIGYIAGSTGDVIIDDSTWTNNNNLEVGRAGNATLDIRNGGIVTTTGYTTISTLAGATAVLTVDTGSTFTCNGDLNVGKLGEGTLNIRSGADVTSGRCYIGKSAADEGTVTVEGLGSSWEAGFKIYVGYSGPGTLNLYDDATISVQAGADLISISALAGSAGTMNIGNGDGTTAGTVSVSQIQGGLGTTGIVNFNHDNPSAYTFSTPLTNNLVVNQIGPGTTVLTGANTYTGANTISDGTLQFAKTASLYNSATGSWTATNIKVASGGTVAFNVGGTDEFTTGDVTTLLTNLKTIANNGLQAGSFIGFDTTNSSGGTLTIVDIIADSTGAGSGAVGVTKLGTNTLVLSGINTYTGATTINVGTLAIAETQTTTTFNFTGAGTMTLADTKNITGAITTGTTDQGTFQVLGTSTVNGSIGTSTELLKKVQIDTGATLNLADGKNIYATDIDGGAADKGTLTFVGTSAVNTTNKLGNTNGLLAVNFTGAGKTVTLSDDIKAVTTALTGGTLYIGSNQLTFTGGYDQQASTILSIDVASLASAGKITTTGDGKTSGTSTISVDVPTGLYIPTGTVYTVLTAGNDGGLTKPLTTTNSDRLSWISAVSGKDVTITANRAADGFSSVAANSNEAAVGAVLDNVTNPTSDMTTVLNTLEGLNNSQTDSALNSMEPDTDGSSLQVTQATLDQLTSAVLGHQESLREEESDSTGVSSGTEMLKGVDVWAQAFGSYLHQSPRQSSQGYNANIWGTALGFDLPITTNIRAGTCFGFAQDYVRGKDNSNRNDINSYQWTIYGEYAKDAYYIDLSGSFAYNTYDASRQVAVGAINRTALADYNGQQYAAYIEGGYKFNFKDFGFEKVTVSKLNTQKPCFSLTELNLTPLVSFQYQHLYLDKYTETGANAMNLTVKAQNYDIAQSGFGIKLDYPLDTKYGKLVPELRFKWLYDWIGDAQANTSNFNGGGGSFATNGFTPAQSSWDFGTKLTMFTKNNWTFAANYDFELKEDFYGHYGYVNAKYSF